MSENARIQQRHGTYTDFQADQSNMLPDEIAVIDSGVPNYSGKALAFKSLDGTIKLVKNTDDPVVLADGQVTTDILDDGSVTEDKLAPGSVKSRHIAQGQITNTHIGSRAVRGNQIYLGTIKQENMDEDSVGEDEIIDGSVTEAKLSTNLKNKIKGKSDLLFVPASSSDINNIPVGQLFIYTAGVARKTQSGYEYLGTVSPTFGNVPQFTPRYIGEFRLINNELYVGLSTSQGGYSLVDTGKLVVRLTAQGEVYRADKTCKQIHDAVMAGKQVIIYYKTNTGCSYFQIMRVLEQTVAGGTMYNCSIYSGDSYYFSSGQADSYANFVLDT